MTGESDGGWPSFVRTAHWLIVLLVIAVVPSGYFMSQTYGPSFTDERVRDVHILLSQIHHTLGVLALVVAIAWMIYRLRAARPLWSATTEPWQRASAQAVHLALFMLLLAVPLAGWASLSALADSERFGPTHHWFFGWDRVLPRIWPAKPFDDPMGYALFARAHVWMLWAGLGLLALHVAAALWHHGIRRDSVLRRIWPLT